MMVLLVWSSAWAGTTGKIAGKVTDKESGEPLPGVNVIIVGTTTGAATNINGEFFIVNVPPGSYLLRANLIGYGPVEVRNVQVSVDLTTNVDFQLSTQTIEMGTITVEAVRPLIEKDVTSSRTTITPAQITDSAAGGIVAAANRAAGAVLGSFRGGRINQGEVIYMLDGVNLSNPLGETRVGLNPGSGPSTALGAYIPDEAISEAEVLTGGFGAEYPNVQSAVINMVTKGGGDRYTGKIKSKSSPNILFGSDNREDQVFDVTRVIDGVTDTVQVVVNRSKVDEFNRNEFWDMRQHEFSFGGPIPIAPADVPGKLSFFASGIYTFNRSYQDERGWAKSQSLHGKLTYELTASRKLYISGLRSTGGRLSWDRQRMLNMTWGHPTYYYEYPRSTADNSRQVTAASYTPYSWIVAPGHVEDEADTVFFNALADITEDDSWLSANFGNYEAVPESLLDQARAAVDASGIARGYTAYDMGNTLSRPEDWSNQFSINFVNNMSAKTFYSIQYSRFLSAQRARVYDPWDGHPLSDTELLEVRFSPKITSIAGIIRTNPMYVSRFRQDDRTITHTLKTDFTSQVNSYNFIKLGFEGKQYDLFYDYRSVASGNNEYNSQYKEKPFQLGVYAQDKIETQGMIVNLGLRYDYFDPKTVVPYNILQPLNPGYNDVNNPLYGETWDLQARLKNPVSASQKQQLSPRVGVSFPITDRDVLHVTYGHYFQLPVFDDFYTNHAFDLRGAFKYIGNPNLSEQKTVAYEAGIDHGFNDYLKLAVTGFFKDIADLINHQRFYNAQTGDIFWIYQNSDYARVKGFEVTMSQRPWRGLSGLISYSYQIARGRASSKIQGFEDNYFNRKPRTEDFPLDWDQRHTLKANANYRTPMTWGAIIGDLGFDFNYTFGSGRPFTGVSRVIPPNIPPINNKRFPNAFTIDMRVDKGFALYESLHLNGFVEIQNLTNEAAVNLNVANEDNFDAEYYEDTTDPTGQYGDPSFWTAPRRILLGMQLQF
jgi:outer membrane receptor protein involved in Fe transport